MKDNSNNLWTAKKIVSLRERYGEIQRVFCLRLGVDVFTLRYWEQGRGQPNGSARILLSRLEEDIDAGKVRELVTA